MNRSRLGYLVFSIAFTLAGCNASRTTPEPKPAVPPPFGHLDMPTRGTTATGPAIEIRGWVLDSSDTQPFIKLSVDDQPIEVALQRMARRDVCAANPAIKHCATSKPGFVLSLATARLSDGSHM